MTYSIEYEFEALADLEKLAPDIRRRIVNKIEWLAQNFEQRTHTTARQPGPLTSDSSTYPMRFR